MLIFTVIVSVLLLVSLFFKYRYDYWKRRGIVGPQPLFLLGNVGRAIFLKVGLADLCTQMYNAYDNYKYVGFFDMWKPCLLIRDPEIVKDIMIKNFKKFQHGWIKTDESADPLIGRNPFVLKGEKWKTVRGQLTPLLTQGKVKSMFPLIINNCKNMIEYLQTNVKRTDVDAMEFSIRFTSDTLSNCALGIEGNAFKDDSEIFKIFQWFASPKTHSGFNKMLTFFFPTISKWLRIPFIGVNVPKKFYEIVEETYKYRQTNNIVRNDYFEAVTQIKSTPEFEYTTEHMIANVFTFFLDGTEASGLTIAFALYELAANLEIQHKAREEVDKAFQSCDNDITFDAIQEMTYLNNIVQEVLRKYPVVLFIARVCTEEYNLPPASKHQETELKIEKGTPVFIPLEAMQWDPKFYPDPEKFDPDRFNDDVKNSRPKCVYLGFGEGPRVCIGKTFATFQIKCALAHILRNFEVKLNKNAISPMQKGFCQFFITIKHKIAVDFYERRDLDKN